MPTHPNDWLDAEQADRDDLAEAAFARLMAELPPVAPSAEFVARTTGAVAARQARRRRRAWAARAAVAAGVVVGAGVGLLAAGPALAPHLGDGLRAGARGLVWVSGVFGSGLRLWTFFSHMGSAVAAGVATPQAASVLVGLALTGAVALVGMQRLLGDEAAQEEAHV